MLAIPIPFILAFALCLMLALALGRVSAGPLASLLALAAVQSVLIGLRWTFDLPLVRFVLPVTAAALPPLAYAAGNALLRRPGGAIARTLGPAVLLAVLVLTLVWRTPIDLVLVLNEAGHGIMILAAARPSDEAPAKDRFADRPVALGLGLLLVAFAVTDGIVGADFAWGGGGDAPAIVSAAGLITLAGLTCLGVLIGRRRPESAGDRHETGSGSPPAATATPLPAVEDGPGPEDVAVLEVVTRLMRDRALHRDADLTLDKLARRAAVPARAISTAVNRLHGQNVSQFVNGFRVAEAQRLLDASDRPVTAIMLDAGFQTKSNFNREFRRIAGCSPTEWRQRSRPGRGG